MARALVIGAGGAARVAAHALAKMEEFDDIRIASRTLEKCLKIQADVGGKVSAVSQLDANDKDAVVREITAADADVVVHLALPYQNLSIMEACLETGVPYLDTANYEAPDLLTFSYSWQWDYHDAFEKAGVTALLGCGFDPGVTSVFVAWAAKHLFGGKPKLVDIVDCNGGDHGLPFATNFNLEINLREVTLPGWYYEDGRWIKTPPFARKSFMRLPGVGRAPMYLLNHEEMESLVKNFPSIERIRFWMSFSDEYLTHLRVLQNCGLTSIEPVTVNLDGRAVEIVPLQFLAALMPEPASLGDGYTGKVCIGNVMTGEDGQAHFVYCVKDHQACVTATGTHAVPFTTGVPAAIGAKLLVTGQWSLPGTRNVEEFDPDPFMEDLKVCGLPWEHRELGKPHFDWEEELDLLPR
ncbi:MAG: saccharopine dehydrogenase family protein [Deltaproteobacteria bacterium]|nr:saccharopine dehydrogenase family protein [Deltaproteobacteria bacterium]